MSTGRPVFAVRPKPGIASGATESLHQEIDEHAASCWHLLARRHGSVKRQRHTPPIGHHAIVLLQIRGLLRAPTMLPVGRRRPMAWQITIANSRRYGRFRSQAHTRAMAPKPMSAEEIERQRRENLTEDLPAPMARLNCCAGGAA